MAKNKQVTLLDRLVVHFAPSWGVKRLRSRMIAGTLAHHGRHFEAATLGRRTSNWNRSGADANNAAGPALVTLRALTRDLVRNNPWARRGLRVIANNTVGWGIVPMPRTATREAAEAVLGVWNRWAGSTQCDADGRLTFTGLQRQGMETIAEAGEVLIRRRPRRAADGLAIPMQLQLLEPDFIDTTKDGLVGPAGGPIIQGVEFDRIGKRVAYWLYEQHPGSNRIGRFASRPVPASEILHVYRLDRPGQVRGVPWFAPTIVRLRDFDEYEDATLMRQKIAACFAGFITDVEGGGTLAGEPDAQDPLVETIEPGMMNKLPPGKEVTFANPPIVANDGFAERTLRGIASGIGVSYEDLTGDYSRVNFSSARMARISHWANVEDWRWNMLVPQLCDGVWAWAMEAAAAAGAIEAAELPGATWTPPAMPMLEPDREGLALARLVRSGAMTPSEVARERGWDWETFVEEYKRDLARLDEAGIWLDSDVRRVSAAGLTQQRAGLSGDAASEGDGAQQ